MHVSVSECVSVCVCVCMYMCRCVWKDEVIIETFQHKVNYLHAWSKIYTA